MKADSSDYNKAYYRSHKESMNATSAAYRKANRDKFREYSKKWRAKHKARHAATQALRRATKLQATPKWLTKSQREHIRLNYELAEYLTKNWGQKFEVDHIIPLKGKLVSGLHVPWNLQIMVQEANRQKGNRHE